MTQAPAAIFKIPTESPQPAPLVAKLEMVVKIRLEADAPNMRKPGAAPIAHYLEPDRLPVRDRWSRKHAHTQRRAKSPARSSWLLFG